MEREEYKNDGKLIIALSRAIQLTHKKSEVLFRKYKITFAQFTVLEALLHKGDMTIKEIIEVILSSSGNMTVVIKNLEQCQLIKRKENVNDKRSYIIVLTEKGKQLIEEVYKQHMDLIHESLLPLSEEEKKIVIDILKKLH